MTSPKVSALPRRLALYACLYVALSLTTPGAFAADPDQRSLISLARAAVRAEVEGKSLPPSPRRSPPRPVFVTIESRGLVLGCRGALECRCASLEEEVVLAARAAAKHDPRHRPLTPKDLADFQVTVTVIERQEPLDRVDSLRPEDGLVLECQGRIGVVLPWEGKDPQVRLKWAYRKAGVPDGTACRLYRLEAKRTRG